jgi:hypothetical protein
MHSFSFLKMDEPYIKESSLVAMDFFFLVWILERIVLTSGEFGIFLQVFHSETSRELGETF